MVIASNSFLVDSLEFDNTVTRRRSVRVHGRRRQTHSPSDMLRQRPAKMPSPSAPAPLPQARSPLAPERPPATAAPRSVTKRWRPGIARRPSVTARRRHMQMRRLSAPAREPLATTRCRSAPSLRPTRCLDRPREKAAAVSRSRRTSSRRTITAISPRPLTRCRAWSGDSTNRATA